MEEHDAVAAVRAALPGARRPDRQYRLAGYGVELAVHEWGEEHATPLLVLHGGFDFAGTLDVFAPLLADAGRRVVAWDQRGHGDSAHCALYSWDADVRDALVVFDAVGDRPVDVVGHSKGGNLMLQLADAQPHRFRTLVNLDGIPTGARAPDISERDRTRMSADELTGWLDHRRSLRDRKRRADSIDGLASRRSKMNPRLPIDWLRYLVTVGARRDDDGWRWKIDPALRLGGFGPRRPEWALRSLAALGMPFLGVLGTVTEQMGWGSRADDVRGHLPRTARVVELDGVGHFVHIEQPRVVADLVLDFVS